jgi:hypothetical protein
MKKRKEKKKPQISGKPIKNRTELFKRGNVGLARLLIAVSKAGPDGIATYQLLHQLGSTNHAKAFIARAEKQGYIKRKEGEPPGPGQFKPIYNILTNKGRQLLQTLSM